MARLTWFLCLTIAANFAFAQTQPASRPATQPSHDKPQTSPLADKLSITEHDLKLGDKSLHYRALAGYLPMNSEAGKLRANFFFVAYELASAGPANKRPITFVFNGGPGAAAIWLHIGTAGPKRLTLNEEGYPGRPPYRLQDNPTSWLAASDLVFIDPIGTGYSRVAEGGKGEEFYGVSQDIESISEFIRLYLVRAKRWDSPKFIAGESYGTTRGAMLSNHLLDRHGIALNGVIFISTVFNFQTLNPSISNELPYALYLPTYTACAHYHKRLPEDLLKDDLATVLKEVQQWVHDTYVPAMMRGSSLDSARRKVLVAQIARYTGLTETYIEKNNLRIDPGEFQKELLADRRQIIGRFDGRIIGDALDPSSSHPDHDPSLSRYVGIYSESFNAYVRENLKFETDLNYEILSGRVHPWNWGQPANGGYLYVGDHLRRAIVKNPHMKVLFASGWYDMATPFFATDYTVNHFDLTPASRANIRQTYYDGGHMMYHHQPSLKKLNDDIKSFVNWATEK